MLMSNLKKERKKEEEIFGTLILFSIKNKSSFVEEKFYILKMTRGKNTSGNLVSIYYVLCGYSAS